jgi:hypothetical protein
MKQWQDDNQDVSIMHIPNILCGEKRVGTTILYRSPNHMSQEFTTLPPDNHVSTMKMTRIMAGHICQLLSVQAQG